MDYLDSKIAEENLYIFGAHSRAQTLGVYLTFLDSEKKIMAYLVDNDEANPERIDGVPVIHLRDDSQLDSTLPVYIAVREVYHKKILDTLRMLGFKNIILNTVKMDCELRNRFMQYYFARTGRNFEKIGTKAGSYDDTMGLYVVKSAFDKPLKVEMPLAPYEKIIQAGCSLTDVRLDDCTCFDDVGDNISSYNRQFCELTALYSIWKNAEESIVGLEHYRRHFEMEEGWILDMKERDIDVILPVPLYVHHNLEENYRKRHVGLVWDVMCDVMKKQGKFYSDAEVFFSENGCYSPCNMFIMKKTVLNELCSWLFPILFEVKKSVGQLDDAYQNRYPGFLSERLISFFFYHYNDKYKVVYADKNFLS